MDTHKLPNMVEAALPPHHRATGGTGKLQGRVPMRPFQGSLNLDAVVCSLTMKGVLLLPILTLLLLHASTRPTRRRGQHIPLWQ